MTDLSTSNLTNFWDGFQERFEEWNGSSDPCYDRNIWYFCTSRWYFSSDECKKYCVNNNYCSLYWTKQAKICCGTCDQTCSSMGESVRGECWTPITTKATTTTTTTTSTTKRPTTRTSTRITTRTTPTTPIDTTTSTTINSESYTKQPFRKSPFISLPIVAGLLLIFIVIYFLRRKIKLSLNMSTDNQSNDWIQPSITVNETETRPTAPSTDDDRSFDNDETNIQIVFPLDTHFPETTEPSAPLNDSLPAYETLNIERPPEYLEIFAKRQSQKQSSESGSSLECTICFEHVNVNRKWTAFVPCGHRICQPCSETISAPSGGPSRNTCPICRKSIKQYLILEGIYDE